VRTALAPFTLLTVLCTLGAGCGGRTAVSSPALACGDQRCAIGEICCLDCDGRGTCGRPGTACAGTACALDAGAGAADASSTACGSTRCQGEVCCLDCNGVGVCNAPRLSCPGQACIGCGDQGQPCCAKLQCNSGLQCCYGEPYPEGGLCAEQCPLQSDRDKKRAFAKVDLDQVLERVAQLPVATWSYIGDPVEARHMGPMAQDFHAAFGLGSSDRQIDTVDANGVLVASIKALKRDVDELRRENAELRRALTELQSARTPHLR
jgi:hypothetical protein